MKIVDCFIFYNELELLLYRLSVLNDFVDYFILVESRQTHAGNEKKLYYKENKKMFQEFNHKIIHIVIDLPYKFPNIDYNKNEQWINENYQRICIKNGIQFLDLNNDDIIIISDLDEIPKPDRLMDIRKGELKINVEKAYELIQDCYYYNLNTLHQQKWIQSKLVSYNYFKQTCPQDIRTKSVCEKIQDGGWHLSYFGNPEFIQNKLKQFGHQELNMDVYTNPELIESRIKNNVDLFDRNYVPIRYISIKENQNLPPLYETLLKNFIMEKE
jgi:beta-1,4-mannosyl-glycoprotein beta-1,4-N-acetylglucosaminyltransferase